MQSKDNLLNLKNNLPRGSKIEISKRTGFTQKTVASILNGCPCRLENFKKVVNTAKAIIRECEELPKL